MSTTGDQFEKNVQQWAQYQSGRLRQRVEGLTLRDKIAIRKAKWNKKNNPNYRPLSPAIGWAVKSRHGLVDRINFRFARHGIFLEHGVGRYRGINSARRNPKPWLAPILDPAIEQLADIVADGYADVMADNIRFLIPGIIDKRLRING